MPDCPDPGSWRNTAALTPGPLDPPECPNFGSDSSGSDSGSGDTTAAVLYRTDCVDGVMKLYAATTTVGRTGFGATGYVYVGDQGSCDCGSSDSSSDSGDSSDSGSDSSNSSSSPPNPDSDSSSSSDSGGGVAVPCCPGGLPATLYLTLSGGLGSYPMTYDAGSNTWSTGVVTPPGCGTIEFVLTPCGEGQTVDDFAISFGATGVSCGFGIPLPSDKAVDCGPPFLYSETVEIVTVGFGSCPCAGTTTTATITE